MFIKKEHKNLESLCSLIPNCSNCQNALILNNSYQNICEACQDPKKINSNSGFPTSNFYLCQICFSQSKNCLKCQKKNNPEPSPSANSRIKLIQVYCFVHKTKFADKFDQSSLTTFCDQCLSDAKPLTTFNLYKFLESKFLVFYAENFKKFCPERRKFFFTNTTEELLNVCRWISEFESIKCVNHLNKNATSLDDKFIGYCEDCSSVPQKYQLSNPLIHTILLSDAYEIAKSTPSLYLNKYILKILKTRLTDKKRSESLNLLILEARDLVSQKKTVFIRCANCLVKITRGTQSGIINSCKHVFCFNCFYIESFDYCPVDHKEIFEQVYQTPSLSEIIPNCHDSHSLFNCKFEVFKLPCHHYSCEPCMKYGFCLSCWKSFDMFKEICDEKKIKEPKIDQKIMNLVEFCRMVCKRHEKSIEKYDVHNNVLLCDECETQQDSIILFVQSYPDVFINTLNQRIMLMIRTEKNNLTINQNYLKKAAYYNVLDFQTVSELLPAFSLLTKNFAVYDDFLEFRRFETIFPLEKSSTKR